MRLRPNHSRLLLSPLFALQEKTPNWTNHAPTKVHNQGNHKSRGTNGAPEIPGVGGWETKNVNWVADSNCLAEREVRSIQAQAKIHAALVSSLFGSKPAYMQS